MISVFVAIVDFLLVVRGARGAATEAMFCACSWDSEEVMVVYIYIVVSDGGFQICLCPS